MLHKGDMQLRFHDTSDVVVFSPYRSERFVRQGQGDFEESRRPPCSNNGYDEDDIGSEANNGRTEVGQIQSGFYR
jgi:hypothetical protein